MTAAARPAAPSKPPRRRADRMLGLLAAGCIAFAATFVDAARLRASRAPARAARAALTARLGLTDLALMTEARYARHPSQRDLHSAFQEHPVAFDHFPAGSILAPPRPAPPRPAPPRVAPRVAPPDQSPAGPD